jgi:hypothetical protein
VGCSNQHPAGGISARWQSLDLIASSHRLKEVEEDQRDEEKQQRSHGAWRRRGASEQLRKDEMQNSTEVVTCEKT